MSDSADKAPNNESSSRVLSDSRVLSPNNVLNILPRIEVRPMNGRVIGTRSPSIPPMVKHVIGEAAHIAGKNGGCASVAETFDVHPNTVTAAKRETGKAKEILDEEIREVALDRLVGMFSTSVTPEKLATLDVKDATRSMKDLAKVAETFTKRDKNVFNGPTIVLMRPSQHTEDQYDVIDVEAREIR